MAEVELPPSAVRLTDMATFGCESGLHIKGQGTIYDVRWLGHFGRFTCLGSDGLNTLLDFNGTSNVRVNDLSLFGRIDVNRPERSQKLVKLNWVNGYGCSDFQFRNVKLFDADVGIDVGNTGDLMCDFVDCYRTDFISCKSGIRTNNDQSLCHRFEQCGAEACEVVFDIVRGGDIRIEGGGCTNCEYILKAGNGGDNAAGITINNYRPEGPARFAVGYGRKVDINNLWMSDANPVFGLEIGEQATVTIKGGYLRGINPRCIKIGPKSLLILDNVLMPGFMLSAMNIGKGGAVIVRECQRSWGNVMHPNNTYRG